MKQDHSRVRTTLAKSGNASVNSPNSHIAFASLRINIARAFVLVQGHSVGPWERVHALQCHLEFFSASVLEAQIV